MNFSPLEAWPPECFPEPLDFAPLTIPERVLNWGSNGLGGNPWQFKTAKCNQFYYQLHAQVTASFPEIILSPHDLFHAHLIGYNQGERLMMLFHAKEYPSNIEEIKNYYQNKAEKFSTESPSFEKRNFIYLSHLNGGQEIYLVSDEGACEGLFSRWGNNQLAEKKIMKLLPNPKIIGDVNVFLPRNLKQLNYQFYSGKNGDSNTLISDLEEIHTGKSVMERRQANHLMNAWLDFQADPIVYFLTGR